MRQTLHIMRKDIRYLRYDLFLVLALAAILGWMAARHVDTAWVEVLLPLAATFMIVRLIHAETIPGDTQFLITRPYRWSSLAAAKLLFILAFVELPIFLVQLLIIFVEEFPLGHSLPGLLWTQVLMIFAIWFPIAALAAITSGIAPFLFTVLTLFAIGFASQQMIFLSGAVLRWRQHAALWTWSIDWFQRSIVVAAFMIIALPVLYLQYRNRRTLLSRAYSLGVMILALAAYVLTPWQLAMAVESHLSKQPSAGAPLQVSMAIEPKRDLSRNGWGDAVNTYLLLTVTGIQPGDEIGADAVAATIETSGHRTWRTSTTGINLITSFPQSTNLEATIPVDREFYESVRKQPVTIRAAFYFTVFGNARSQSIPLRRKPLNVMDGLQCYLGDKFDHVYCRSAFRWPDLAVYAYSTSMNPLYQLISYSPFPSGISLNDEIEAHWADGPSAPNNHVTIVVKEPLAHVRRDLELRDIRFAR